MTDLHTANRAALNALLQAQCNWEEASVRAALDTLTTPQTLFRLCHPFGTIKGAQTFYDTTLAALHAAWPDVERRDWIVMAGQSEAGDTEAGDEWVGCAGHFFGTFASPFLDIPPTGHLTHMRFHEFYRFKEGKIIEVQMIWDLPEVMMQASAWPMAPSLGREFCVPGPVTGDGLHRPSRDTEQSRRSCDLVVDMLADMIRHPAQGGPQVMELPRYWHPAVNWYGPAGIGSARGIAGFRNWHQIPFLAAMPDRGQYPDEVNHYFFGDNNYAAVTGWPNMAQTVSGDGWLGIAPSDKKITLRSLDFWRIEGDKIRENWVLVDLLDVYHQLGVDVFARLRDFNKARVPGSVPFPVGVA